MVANNMVAGTRYVDTFELTRLGLAMGNKTPLVRFERLVADLPEQGQRTAEWTIQGETDSLGQRFLRLRVKAEPMLVCQRCLAQFGWKVDADTRLRVVNSEAELEEDAVLDEDEPDDFIERIVGSNRLDVEALVEDEIILALPYVAKHDVCPNPPKSLDEGKEPRSEEKRPSPFAVLGQLKKD